MEREPKNPGNDSSNAWRILHILKSDFRDPEHFNALKSLATSDFDCKIINTLYISCFIVNYVLILVGISQELLPKLATLKY